MIGVCVPVHNEERLLQRCLTAIDAATCHPDLAGETVRTLVVLDACDDDSARICRAHGVATVSVDARNVGVARHVGARRLIRAGARWLAFTDADSEVAPDWLARQASLNADAVCGRIRIDGWARLPTEVRRRFCAYRRAQVAEEPVHGANLGVDAAVYLAVGGFPPVRSGEDRGLVRRLLEHNFRVTWSKQVLVQTSARLDARAPGGLGARLHSLGAAECAPAQERAASPPPRFAGDASGG